MSGDVGVDTYADERFFSCRRSMHRGEPDSRPALHAVALESERFQSTAGAEQASAGHSTRFNSWRMKTIPCAVPAEESWSGSSSSSASPEQCRPTAGRICGYDGKR